MTILLRVRLGGPGLGPVDGPRPALPQHDVRLVGLHGRLARGAHGLFTLLAGVAPVPRSRSLVTDAHVHDVGKLCFAFTAFWGYLTFGQFLVIWYGNMAEETHFFTLRLIAPWMRLSLIGGDLRVLRCRSSDCCACSQGVSPDAVTLYAGSASSACPGPRIVEVYPSLYGVTSHVPFGIWEVGIFLGFLGIWGTCYLRVHGRLPACACC